MDQDDLPLLLSKESMKKAGVSIDIEHDCIKIFEQTIKLNTNRSGHYILQLKDMIQNEPEEEEYKVLWQLLDGTNQTEAMRHLEKMHNGLGHPGKNKFEEMLKVTGNFAENIKPLVNKLYERCSTCFKFKKNIPRPHVSPPVGRDFNQTIVVDL